ncbi:response regulator [Aestuariirhabdus haliotis]|uniref:response regulator n=1 Tax=Aestuariirhabdus haliotis TaxID=2918751 RepID=UPI00201B418A|nr:response regulator [Aestuariirhabdus haliotis]MCL6418377.1 response regulator [Aestuariirhabdus haliotis]
MTTYAGEPDASNLIDTSRRIFTGLIKLLVLLLSALPISLANANVDALVVNAEQGSQALGQQISLVRDPDRLLNASDAWNKQADFTANSTAQLHLQYPGQNYWLRFALENPGTINLERILLFDYGLVDEISLYQIVNNQPQQLESISIQRSAMTREIAHRKPAFSLSIPALQTTQYLVKLRFLQKANHSLEAHFSLESYSHFIQHQLKTFAVFACYIGFFMSLVLYNLMLYFKARFDSYLYYSLYLLCTVGSMLSYESLLLFLPTPPPAGWIIGAMNVLPALGGLCLITFGRKILQLNLRSPGLNRFYKQLTFIVLLMACAMVLQIRWLNVATEILAIAATLSMGIVSTRAYYQGYKPAGYFALSFLFIGSGYIIEMTLYTWPLLSWFGEELGSGLIRWMEQYFFYSCAAIEVVFLSLALAAYINQLRDDKDSAQEELLQQLTERNKLKSEYSQQLEQDISRRTAEIHHKNQQLEQHDRLKSQFFANISHEFRTPLTLIQGPFQQLLAGRYGEVNEQLKNAALISQRNVDRLSGLIEELLMLSQIESGKLKLRATTTDFRAFCLQVSRRFGQGSEDREIQFHTNLGDAPIELTFDTVKMDSIVSNLLGNAFKYTPARGAVWLSLDAPSPQPEEHSTGQFVSLRVKNSGNNIPLSEHEKIFERFYRVDNPASHNVEGSGIGLALVRELTELHGGDIYINPELTDHCEFILRLPLGTAHFTPSELQAAHSVIQPVKSDPLSETSSRQPLVQPSPITILLVEDNRDMRRFICSHFDSHFHVLEANHGLEALDIIATQSIDLVISDIMMPHLDGMELLQRLRQQPETQQLPVLLLTARAAVEDKMDALQARADDYIAKPFNVDELLLKTRNLVERHRDYLQHRSDSDIDDDEGQLSVTDALLEKVRNIVLANIQDSEFDVKSLAEQLHVSKATLHRQLAKATDLTPASYIREIRLQQAHQHIEGKHFQTLAEVAYAVGFNHAGYFTKLYKQKFG